MQIDIQEKLHRFLADDPTINDEARVVYLLAQCRKLLEHDKALKNRLPTLDFYCNWALHVQLERSAAQAFLNEVNPILTLNANFNKEQHDAVDSRLTLNAFRSELQSLLACVSADLSICDDASRWTGFLRVYSRVVQDSELAFKGASVPNGPRGLAVKKVTIHPIAGDPPVDHAAAAVYPMLWMIEYADGRIGRLELSQLGLLGATVDLFDPAIAGPRVA